MKLQAENDELIKSNSEKQDIINSLTEQTDLDFENYEVTFNYHYTRYYRSGSYNKSEEKTGKKTVSLVEIFKVISLEMLSCSIGEYIIKEAISKNIINVGSSVFFDDDQIIKKVLNQLTGLKLINSKFVNGNVFWCLTKKGIKYRNELTLKRKSDNSIISQDSE